MELLEKYLQAVRFFLPRRNQDDIVRELSENLLAQIDDKEEASGRPLTESEVADILRRHGHPMLVAGRYGSRQHLIGPIVLPLYFFVLKAGLAIAAVVTLATGAITSVMNGGVFTHLVDEIFEFPARALMVFGWTTLTFMMADYVVARLPMANNWDPRRLPNVIKPSDRVSRMHALCEMLATTVYVAWLLAIPSMPFLLLGPFTAFVQLAPTWRVAYIPVVALAVGTLVLSSVDFLWPYRTSARSWARMAIHGGAFVVFVFVAVAGEWVVAIPSAAAEPGVSRLLQVMNASVGIALWIFAAISAGELVREFWRWQSWRRRSGHFHVVGSFEDNLRR
jgi:hypothetical protein